LVMLLAPFLGKPIPLLPLQLLWLNLLTDGLMGLGLGVEPAERNTMNRPPYSPTEGVFSRGMVRHVAWVGALIGAIALGLGTWYFYTDQPTWQTMVFTTLALSQVWQALATRSLRDSLVTVGLFSNPLLLTMAVLVVGLQMAVVYLGLLEEFFQTEALSAVDLAISVALSSIVFFAIELDKWLVRSRAG
jgi:Ca2+-transporting ATPase